MKTCVFCGTTTSNNGKRDCHASPYGTCKWGPTSPQNKYSCKYCGFKFYATNRDCNASPFKKCEWDADLTPVRKSSGEKENTTNAGKPAVDQRPQRVGTQEDRTRNQARQTEHVSEYQQRPQSSTGGSPPFNETQKLIQKSIAAIGVCFGIYKSFPHPEGADVIANIIIYGIAGFLAGTICAMFYILGAIIILIVGGFYIYYRGWMFLDPKGLDKHMKEIDAKRMVAEQSAPQEKNERSSPLAAAPPPKVRAVEKNETHEPLQQQNPKPSNSATMPAVSTKYYSQPAQNVPQSSVGNPQVLDNRSSTLSSDYSRVDAQLNVAYRTAMARLDQQGQERLRNEQRNWIKQRDAAVSRNPIEAEPIKLKMTILRTRELEQYR